MPLAHRNISKKQCAWIRSSPLVGHCCQSLMPATTSHRVYNQQSLSVKRRGRQPKLRWLFNQISGGAEAVKKIKTNILCSMMTTKRETYSSQTIKHERVLVTDISQLMTHSIIHTCN